MTILYPDFNDFHMQSFPSKKFYEATKCVGYSNTTDKNFKTMAMSVGSDSDSASASNITAQSSGAASSSTITTTNNKNNKTMGKRTGKRPGRKPAKIDERAKLERSRQSAKECRARKKLRYQYLEELVLNREKAVFLLRDELETLKQWCIQLDKGNIPESLMKMIASEDMAKQRKQGEEMKRATELQKQQRLQQLQIQRVHQRDLPSTSSVFNISSNSSSSSSSSSPSPPNVDNARSPHEPSNSFHNQHQQQSSHSKMVVTSQPPPPPYPGTPMRYGLTRQMAFDDGSTAAVPGSHSHHHYPRPQQQHQQQHPSQVHPFPHGRLNAPQPHINPQQQQHTSISSTPTSLHGSSPYHLHQQNVSYDFQNQQPSSSSSSSSSLDNAFKQQNKTGLQNSSVAASSINNIHIPSPVTTSAYLDDISDLISNETTRHPSGQFTTAPSTANNYHGEPSAQSPISTSRMRSLSNPTVMANLNRPQHPFFNNVNQHPNQPPRRSASFTNRNYPTADNNLHATSRKRHITSDASLSTINEQPMSHESFNKQVGLFSGIPIISTTISDGESDSADENPNISGLFQSSSNTTSTMGQKRMSSEPNVHPIQKKAKSLDTEMDSILTDSLLVLYNETDQTQTPYNPITKLNNLTTVKCMGSTGTLNTTSAASPFGFSPRNTDSPMTTSSGVTSPAPSCHSGLTSLSPVPQLSTFLEGSNSSSALSLALMEHQDSLEINNALTASFTPTTESFLFSMPTSSTPVVCSETGLSATINEHISIPEWNSFLADLQADNNNLSFPTTPTTTKPIGIMSAHPNTSHPLNFLNSIMDQKQQVMTSSTSSEVLNVPSILEELSSEESA